MSVVPKKYSPSAVNLEFRQRLDDWRCTKVQELFGPAYLKNMGAGFVLGDDTLARIADCARVGKLSSLEDLVKETKWYHTHEYGQDILDLVTQ